MAVCLALPVKKYACTNTAILKLRIIQLEMQINFSVIG